MIGVEEEWVNALVVNTNESKIIIKTARSARFISFLTAVITDA